MKLWNSLSPDTRKYRNEWKYICADADLKQLEHRLSAVLQTDSYADADGSYMIHSLYYDDYHDTCARDTTAGLTARYKWRIRYYGDNLSSLHLERKEKLDSRCHKDSCPLSLDEYALLLSRDISTLFWMTEKPLLKRFCAEIQTRLFVPKLIVDYLRKAYVEELSSVRVTLDRNIAVSGDVEHFLDRNYQSCLLQETGRHVLEVKFDHLLPGYIKNVVTDHHLIQTSFSKYALGRQKIQQYALLHDL